MLVQPTLRKTAPVMTCSILALLFLWAILVPAHAVKAVGPWYVAPSGSDANDCQSPLSPCVTINAALALATSGDTIYVATGVYTATSGEHVVFVNKSVVLSGGWSPDFSRQDGMTTLDGQGARRGMMVEGEENHVSVERFIFTHGLATHGAGIYNSAALTLTQVWVHNNIAGHAGWTGGGGGGGIANWSGGVLVLNQSTVSDNHILGGFSGAGVLCFGNASINNSTLSGNGGVESLYVSIPLGRVDFNNSTLVCSSSGFCGIKREHGSVYVKNSVLRASSGVLCNTYSGRVASSGYNIVSDESCFLELTDQLTDPLLTPLQHHNGWMPSHAPQKLSPAINAADPAGCTDSLGQPFLFDQHGTQRLDRCDIGAVEASYATYLSLSGVTLPGHVVTQKVTLQNVVQTGTFAGVVITDILPAGLTYQPETLTFSNGSGAVVSNTLTWSGDIFAHTDTLITFRALISPTLPVGDRITNTVMGLWQGVRSHAQASFDARARQYVPFCLRYHCENYFDDFSLPTSGWPIVDTSAARYGYINGEYRILSKALSFFLVRAPTCTRENYVVEADVRWEGSRGGTIGLLFGIQGNFDQFYLFDINVDNSWYRLLRANADGSVTTLVDWTGTYRLSDSTKLKAVFNKGQITLFINSSVEENLYDSTIAGFTGVGIVSSPYGNNPTSDARFDNFRVTMLPSATAGILETQLPGTSLEGISRLEDYLLWQPVRAR